VNDPYGYPGGSSPPTSNSTAATFVTELLARYNDVIDSVQVWNEPEYSLAFFWNGTAAQMAALARAVAGPVRAAGKTVMAPSEHKETGVNLVAFLNAADGSGGFGRDHIDEVSFQAYGYYGLRDHRKPPTVEITATYINGIKAAIVAGGRTVVGTPIHFSEIGYGPSGTDPDLLASTPYDIAMYLEQTAIVCFTQGVQSVCLYQHDTATAGNPSINPVIAQACGRIASLAGRTITALTLERTGGYRLDTSLGPVYFGHV
jgi:hypothetical protein